MKVYTYTVDQISQYGIDYQALKDSLKLEFLNRVFVRSGDFPQRFRQEAIKVYMEQKQASLRSFLVETPFLITIWTEEKTSEENTIPENKPQVSKSSQNDLNFPSCPVKMYRGVPYQSQPAAKTSNEEEIDKIAEEDPEILGYWQKKLNFTDKPVKTYRGIPY